LACCFTLGSTQVDLKAALSLDGDFGDTEAIKRANYKAFVSSRLDDYDEFERNLLTKGAIGSESFLKTLEESFRIQISRRGRGRPRNEVANILGK